MSTRLAILPYVITQVSKLDARDTSATSTLDPMRILALFALAVSVDALHALHPAASVLLKPALRACAQRHLLSASAVLSTGDMPGSAPQVERTRSTWPEQTRPTLVKALSAYASIILPVTLAARIANDRRCQGSRIHPSRHHTKPPECCPGHRATTPAEHSINNCPCGNSRTNSRYLHLLAQHAGDIYRGSGRPDHAYSR